MKGEWNERLVQEEGQGWAAQGCNFLLTAETMDKRGVQGIAIGGLGLIHACVWERQLMLHQFLVGATEITQTHRQLGRAI